MTREQDEDVYYESESWRGWYLDRKNIALVHREPGGEYDVDILRCRSSAETLDWIIQIAHKSWATDDVIAGLIRALDDLIDVQGVLCPGGRSRNIPLSYLYERIPTYGMTDD